jgi:hypothetical protein
LSAPSPPDTSLVLSGSVQPAQIPMLCDRLGDLVAGGAAGLVVCDVSRVVVNLDAVEALARLELAARRLGTRITIFGASSQLDGLIASCGLVGVLRTCAPVAPAPMPVPMSERDVAADELDPRAQPPPG